MPQHAYSAQLILSGPGLDPEALSDAIGLRYSDVLRQAVADGSVDEPTVCWVLESRRVECEYAYEVIEEILALVLPKKDILVDVVGRLGLGVHLQVDVETGDPSVPSSTYLRAEGAELLAALGGAFCVYQYAPAPGDGARSD